MHNDIMLGGSKDRPPMLATGRYAQWQSRFTRYVDTKPNMKELKKCIFNGPCVMTRVHVPAKPTTKTYPAVPKHTVPETYENILHENRDYIDSEAKAIHMILSEIEDEIYSTGESLNKQDVKTNLFWEFGKFTSRDWDSIESYYLRLYKMMNEMNEVNEIRAEKIDRNVNPLALVAAAQKYPNDNYYHVPKSHKNQTTSSRHTSSTNDTDPDEAQRDKDMQKSIALIAKYFTKIYKPTNNNLRTSSNSKNKNVDSTPRTRNERQSG
ncbi:hypothetical protein Tco_0893576 [Tanacetum coccineum]|uniref:Gag protein n=1 Tax=Tanacetum coccineum TaxID=301880 RepID=A0ABQ5CEL7_9ASTR